MKKSYLIALVLSVIVSVAFTFNSPTLGLFIVRAIVLYAILSVGLSIFFLVFRVVRRKYGYRGLALYVIAVTIAVILFVKIVLSVLSVRLPAVTPDHFRTNIFTGDCEYGGYSPYLKSDPWYYEEGCDGVSEEEKLRIMFSSPTVRPL